ncbi:hypothetical protein EXIGLDRAFT_834732 [Exidia glandulosa HHB12029]|uniref:Uncharacterized protein n=1 Tax=Exidia glandulosa HHB12029 TaxID=1314781 RepID=A0A165JF15_EXIGL|nr:hypothetical protein EXIGLDRAFT_834732 [Exidia glandulosa HHB12029]
MTTPPVTTSESLEPWKDPHQRQDVDLSNEAPTSEPLKTKGDLTTLIMQSSANGRVYEFVYWILQHPHADPTAPIIYEVICTDPPEILAHCDDAVCASDTCFDFPPDSPVGLDLVSGLSLDLAGFSTVLDATQKRFSFPRCAHIVLSSRLGEIDLGSFLEDIRTAGELLHWLDLPNASEISFGDASAVGFSIDYPPVPVDH